MFNIVFQIEGFIIFYDEHTEYKMQYTQIFDCKLFGRLSQRLSEDTTYSIFTSCKI